ncbi:cuticle protein CP1876-like [Macrobrachium rosenbergii]|uniref:cuticle protein CP1876-like n=1 Tax=Macrobrachium rosenbergii TaxID=79674 RepID=UPI0034D60409
MRSLVLLSVVLGVALGAPQHGFPMDTAEVAAARAAFVAEYNRLADLAARAPDIHIIHRDPIEHQRAIQQAANHVPQSVPVPTFNAFSFSANLGRNQQFVPGPNTFPGAGHLAGHLAGHQAPAPAAPHRFSAPDAPTPKWQGPFAHTIPAGVQGSQAQTVETPEVAAARNAHFAAHAAVLGFQG